MQFLGDAVVFVVVLGGGKQEQHSQHNKKRQQVAFTIVDLRFAVLKLTNFL
jgi:hypothetical protein